MAGTIRRPRPSPAGPGLRAGGRGRPAPRHPTPSRHGSRRFFLRPWAQQVTGTGPLPVLPADLAAASMMVGALVLWGVALHLLAA